jgi:hypothetical protein
MLVFLEKPIVRPVRQYRPSGDAIAGATLSDWLKKAEMVETNGVEMTVKMKFLYDMKNRNSKRAVDTLLEAIAGLRLAAEDTRGS